MKLEELEDCPDCPNQGWYYDSDPYYGSQEQCEWCWCNHNSKFNIMRNLEMKERGEEFPKDLSSLF